MFMSFRTYGRDVNPFETDTKGRLFVVDVSINWPSNRNWLTKVLDSWKVNQLNWLRQKWVKLCSVGGCTELLVKCVVNAPCDVHDSRLIQSGGHTLIIPLNASHAAERFSSLHIQRYTRTQTIFHTRSQAHEHTQTLAYMGAHERVCTLVHTYTHTCTHTLTHARTHLYIQNHMHTPAYTTAHSHKCTQTTACAVFLSLSILPPVNSIVTHTYAHNYAPITWACSCCLLVA